MTIPRRSSSPFGSQIADSGWTINPERITLLNELVLNAQTFVCQVYLPDVLAIAGFYPEWFTYGAGTGNYMTCGDYSGDNSKSTSGFSFPRGIVLGRDLATVLPLDPNNVVPFLLQTVRAPGQLAQWTAAAPALATPARGCRDIKVFT